MTLKIEAALLCDDVRQEASGKHILIGVVGGILGVQRLPSNLRATWFLQLRVDKGTHKFDFRVTGPNDAQLLAGGVEFDAIAPGLTALPMPRQQIQIQSAGPLRLEWRKTPNDEWEVIKEYTVIHGTPSYQAAPPISSATASPQPPAQSQPAASKS